MSSQKRPGKNFFSLYRYESSIKIFFNVYVSHGIYKILTVSAHGRNISKDNCRQILDRCEFAFTHRRDFNGMLNFQISRCLAI